MDGFKVVDQAAKPPGKCIASRDIEGPFIDTGNNITERGRVYLSCRWVKEAAAEFCDMVPLEEVEERFATLEDQVKEQAKKLASLERFEEAAAEYVEAREAVTT
jgi:hypothetical protein